MNVLAPRAVHDGAARIYQIPISCKISDGHSSKIARVATPVMNIFSFEYNDTFSSSSRKGMVAQQQRRRVDYVGIRSIAHPLLTVLFISTYKQTISKVLEGMLNLICPSFAHSIPPRQISHPRLLLAMIWPSLGSKANRRLQEKSLWWVP